MPRAFCSNGGAQTNQAALYTFSSRAGSESNNVLLRAERSGKGDGRVYRIASTVSDGKGGTCSGTVLVGVPHDQGKGSTPVDSAPPSFNSFGP